MDPELLKGFLRLGLFIGVGGLALMFFQPRSSPEFVVSVCSAMMGGVLVVGVVLLSRFMDRD
jgi:hypothetical protein